jgi:hypothetical protein
MFMRYTHLGVGHTEMLRRISKDCLPVLAEAVNLSGQEGEVHGEVGDGEISDDEGEGNEDYEESDDDFSDGELDEESGDENGDEDEDEDGEDELDFTF